MKKYTMTPDGKYIFPRRGDPPPCPAGYKPAPGDPYTLEPDFENPCVRRDIQSKRLPCGSCATVFFCKEMNCITTPIFCNTQCGVPLEIRRGGTRESISEK